MAAGAIVSSRSKIEWTDATWNPVTGCTPISEGCEHCYAQRILHRFGRPKTVVCHERRLFEPVKWKPRRVFVCSMGDLFHRDVPDAFIRKVYAVMTEVAPHHVYQILTKRPGRLLALWPSLTKYSTEHIWHGVSVEDQRTRWRMSVLDSVPSPTRFVSFEPLIGPVALTCVHTRNIHWIIVGGETGSGARPMKAAWVRGLRDTAEREGIPFFFKQWGGKRKGAELDGRIWKQMPGHE